LITDFALYADVKLLKESLFYKSLINRN